jgi:hypothetical protein
VTAVLIVLGIAVVVLLAVTLHLARRGLPAGSDDKVQARSPVVPPPKVNVAVVTRYELWMNRVEQEKLGADDGLLPEVLYAAGGVERELRDLRKALEDEQQLAAQEPPRPTVLLQERPAPAPAPAPAAQRQPIGGPYAAARPVREASYSFVNLVAWARSTVDRTDRPSKPGSSGRAGLLPSLPPGEVRDGVAAALQHLRTALKDSRSRSGAAFDAGVASPALAAEELDFSPDRDLLTYATELMAAVEIFVNQVLDAFAAGQAANA